MHRRTPHVPIHTPSPAWPRPYLSGVAHFRATVTGVPNAILVPVRLQRVGHLGAVIQHVGNPCKDSVGWMSSPSPPSPVWQHPGSTSTPGPAQAPESRSPSPSMSLSQASPSPLLSVSRWSLFGTLGQLSQASPKESVSEFCWSLLGKSRQLSCGEGDRDACAVVAAVPQLLRHTRRHIPEPGEVSQGIHHQAKACPSRPTLQAQSPPRS